MGKTGGAGYGVQMPGVQAKFRFKRKIPLKYDCPHTFTCTRTLSAQAPSTFPELDMLMGRRQEMHVLSHANALNWDNARLEWAACRRASTGWWRVERAVCP